MNPSEQNSITESSGSGDFESTLRLIARLSAPQGLEERIQAGLRAAPASASGGSRILAWPTALRADAVWMRSAAAAAIVAVVIGGSFGVYSRVQSIQPTRAITVPLHLSTQGGFSSAGAMRTPQTLNGPIVEPSILARPVSAVPQPVKPAEKPVLKTPLHPGKTAQTGIGTSQFAAPGPR
jgi:hypothetical protein